MVRMYRFGEKRFKDWYFFDGYYFQSCFGKKNYKSGTIMTKNFHNFYQVVNGELKQICPKKAFAKFGLKVKKDFIVYRFSPRPVKKTSYRKPRVDSKMNDSKNIKISKEDSIKKMKEIQQEIITNSKRKMKDKLEEDLINMDNTKQSAYALFMDIVSKDKYMKIIRDKLFVRRKRTKKYLIIDLKTGYYDKCLWISNGNELPYWDWVLTLALAYAHGPNIEYYQLD